MKKRVLLIGGAGYVGSHVALRFAEAGYRVAVLDDLSSGCRENVVAGAEFHEGNFLDAPFLRKALAGSDGVVHLAALKSAGVSMSEPAAYAEQNIGGMSVLLAAMEAEGVSDLVFSSSAAVYGKPRYLPLDEEHPVEPVNFYGFTKLVGERLMDWHARLKGVRFASLRYFNAVGYDPEGRVAGLEKRPNNLLPVLMEALFGLREKMEIFGAGYPTADGTCVRDYVHVSDLAEAHLSALESLGSGGPNLTLNLGSGKFFSVKRIVDAAVERFGIPLRVEVSPPRAGDPAELYAHSGKAERLLGWKAKITTLEEILDTTFLPYRRKYGEPRRK